MKKKIYILGVGGFAKEVYFLLQDLNKFEVEGFIDLHPQQSNIVVEKNIVPVFSEEEHLQKGLDNVHYAIGTGNPQITRKILKKFGEKSFPNLIHPNSTYSKNSLLLGKGNIITAGCRFTVNIKLGSYNIFNLNSTIGHDTIIGDGNIINPGANISGGCNIGNFNLLGTSSTILQYLEIGDYNVIGASTLVTKNIDNNGLFIGIPAKKIKQL